MSSAVLLSMLISSDYSHGLSYTTVCAAANLNNFFLYLLILISKKKKNSIFMLNFVWQVICEYELDCRL